MGRFGAGARALASSSVRAVLKFNKLYTLTYAKDYLTGRMGHSPVNGDIFMFVWVCCFALFICQAQAAHTHSPTEDTKRRPCDGAYTNRTTRTRIQMARIMPPPRGTDGGGSELGMQFPRAPRPLIHRHALNKAFNRQFRCLLSVPHTTPYS